MHDPILHIKDSYFFEIPRRLWQYHYTSLDQVPEFLRLAHKDITDVKVFNDGLAGKILLYPQPFGTLKNLYEPASGLCISRFMILEVLAAAILIYIGLRMAAKLRHGNAVRGVFWNFIEAMLFFIRDEVARPAIGKHDADKYVPLLWTMFLFVLTCNLFGLIPFLGTPSGAFAMTGALAAVTLLVGMLFGMIHFGPVKFWLHYLPHMELPLILAIILKPAILFLELFGSLIRHVVLGFRLLANMVAGHLVILGIMGLILGVATASAGQFTFVTVLAVVGSALFSCLELFVAFLQAYIFTFLSALFIGAAVHEH